MGELFIRIYGIFENFFGLDLSDYLSGNTAANDTNLFIGIGLSMLGISLAIGLIYYYVVNHPRLNNLWGWGLFLLLNSIINFVVGWQWTQHDYNMGKMMVPDPSTDQYVPMNIDTTNCLSFGVTNMLLSIISFIIISYIIKWWSSNCSKAPF